MPARSGRIAFCDENNRLVAQDLRTGSSRSGPPIHIAQKSLENRHSRERFSPQPPIYGGRCATAALTQIRGTRPRMASSGRIRSYGGMKIGRPDAPVKPRKSRCRSRRTTPRQLCPPNRAFPTSYAAGSFTLAQMSYYVRSFRASWTDRSKTAEAK